jgi:hypothetical protein
MLDDRPILLKINVHVDDSSKRVECRRDLPGAPIARHSNDLERCDLNRSGSTRCWLLHASITQAWALHYTERS